jgi:excisionase family DNA binding protein
MPAQTRSRSKAPRPGSLKRAAEQLGISLPSVYVLIRSGKLRTYHVGRAHRVSDEAIRECVALLERESAPSERCHAERRE